MIRNIDDNHNCSLRRQSRIEKNEDIFTLSGSEYDMYLELLNSDDLQVLTKAMNMFSRHYIYNEFEYNDQTHFVLTTAVSSIVYYGNQLTDFTQNSFDLLSHAIDNTLNGLAFIIQTNALDVLKNNVANIESPFFDQAIISLAKIAWKSPQICEMIKKDFPIDFFIDIMENYDVDSNPDVPYYILWILYFYTKYKYLSNEQSFQMLDFLNNTLNNLYNRIKDKQPIKSYDYDIFRVCITILTILFEKSALFRDTELTSNFILIFNEIIQLDVNESSSVRKLISEVLHAFIPLVKYGAAFKEPGIDIICVASLIETNYSRIQPAVLDCIYFYINSSHQSIKLLVQTRILHYLKKILKNGSFNTKKKILSIIEVIMNYGTNEDKLLILKPNIVASIIFLANEGNDEIYLDSIRLIDSMLKLETTLDYDFQIHSTFLEAGGVQMDEEKSQQFINDHFGDNEEEE